MSLSDDAMRRLLADPSAAPACARHIGLEVLEFSVDGGWSEMGFQPRPEFANPAGNVQGGFLCAMLDDCMSLNATIATRFTMMVPTLQMATTFVRPAPMERLLGRGEVLHLGRSAVQMQGRLRTVAGETIAVATASAILRPFPKRA